jgi:hypothetical protein
MEYGDKLKTLIGKEGHLSTSGYLFSLYFNHPKFSQSRRGTKGTIKEVGEDFVVIASREFDIDEKETTTLLYEIIIPLNRFFVHIYQQV